MVYVLRGDTHAMIIQKAVQAVAGRTGLIANVPRTVNSVSSSSAPNVEV